MIKRLRKLKSSVRFCAANYKNDQDSNITAKGLQLVTQITILHEPFFFFAAKECISLPQGQEKSGKIKKNYKRQV